MSKLRERIILVFLALCCAVLSTRYYPEQPGKTTFETMTHFLSMAPITMGATLIIVSLLQKTTGHRLPWGKIIRIFLTIAICLEILVGLSIYFQGGMGPVSG